MRSLARFIVFGIVAPAIVLIGGSHPAQSQGYSTTITDAFEPIGGIGLSAGEPINGSALLPGTSGLIFRLHHTAGEQFGFRPGFTSFGIHRLIPLAGGVWLVDGQLLLDNEGNAGGSFDSMWRWSTTGETVWGLGLGADLTPTEIQHTAQGVVSLEMLRLAWGLRANAYAPFDTNTTSQSTFSNPYGLQGTSILALTTEQLLREQAMTGVDIEFHRRIGAAGGAELFAGAYAFDGQDNEATGFRLGLRGDITENLSAHVQVTQDDLFDTRVSGGLTWFFGPGRSVRNAADRRLTGLVRRNHYVSIDRSTSSSVVETQTATDQVTGDPLHLFVASEGGTGSGAEGDPTGIATALGDPNFGAGSVLVLVDSGGTLTTPIALDADRQQVLGAPSGSLVVDLAAATGDPSARLRLNNLGGRPILEPTAGSAAIRLSSTGIGHTIAGLELAGTGGVADGIRDFNGTPAAPGGTDTLIRDMFINDFAGVGVFIQPSVDTTIESTTFSGNGTDISLNAAGTTLRNISSSGALGDSISLANTSGTTTIENVSVSDTTGAGLSLNNAGGDINVSGFETSNTGGAGIDVQGGDADIEFAGDTTIAGSGTAAVNVQGGTADVSFGDLFVTGSGDHGVLLDGHDGLFTVTRALSVTGAGGSAGVAVQNAGANAAADFGQTTIIATGAGTLGVDLDNNDAASLLTFENLNVTTLDGIGLRADNGGIVDFSGTPAEIAATGGAALDLASTVGRHGGNAGWRFTSLSSTGSTTAGVTLDSLIDDFRVIGATSIDNATGNGFESIGGSGNFTLTSLSVDGATTGLDLIDHSGTFVVTGAGTLAGSGGQIENVSVGARLENVGTAHLQNMALHGTTRGVEGLISNDTDSTISIEDSSLVGGAGVGAYFETAGGSAGDMIANLDGDNVDGQASAVQMSAAGGDIIFWATDNNFNSTANVDVQADESGGATISQNRSNNTVNDERWLRDDSPLLTAGTLGSDGKRETVIADPDVVYDSATGTWHLYYFAGRATKFGDDSDLELYIQHATSPDGTGWVLDAGQALSVPGDPLAWDGGQAETPSILIDPTAPANRRFKLYYAGANGWAPSGEDTFPNYQLGLAFSSDGSTFTRLSAAESPYGEAGLTLHSDDVLGHLDNYDWGILADPEIKLIGGTYNLWFSSFGADSNNDVLAFGISHATSSDGINWTPDGSNPVPSLSWSDGFGGQQPSVAYNSALDRWETYLTSDTAEDKAQMPSTAHPSTGVWMFDSPDAINWDIDILEGRSFNWDGDLPHEALGLLTGLEVVIVDDVRHLFYTGWSSVDPPPGFVVPVQDGYAPAVLTLLHATQSAFED